MIIGVYAEFDAVGDPENGNVTEYRDQMGAPPDRRASISPESP